uniref:Uncharacterized protein n=1 Tax=Rhizophora mucronata TaxID=61149 RepID=A0A2P2Q5P2_RHIMU
MNVCKKCLLLFYDFNNCMFIFVGSFTSYYDYDLFSTSNKIPLPYPSNS